jgi:hypothetical protein
LNASVARHAAVAVGGTLGVGREPGLLQSVEDESNSELVARGIGPSSLGIRLVLVNDCRLSGFL